MLLSKFGHCTVDVKKNLLVFMTYCSSLYCCSLWSAYDIPLHFGVFMLLIKTFLRFMFHLPLYTRVSNIFVSHSIPFFSVFIRRKLVYSMYK